MAQVFKDWQSARFVNVEIDYNYEGPADERKLRKVINEHFDFYRLEVGYGAIEYQLDGAAYQISKTTRRTWLHITVYDVQLHDAGEMVGNFDAYELEDDMSILADGLQDDYPIQAVRLL